MEQTREKNAELEADKAALEADKKAMQDQLNEWKERTEKVEKEAHAKMSRDRDNTDSLVLEITQKFGVSSLNEVSMRRDHELQKNREESARRMAAEDKMRNAIWVTDRLKIQMVQLQEEKEAAKKEAAATRQADKQNLINLMQEQYDGERRALQEKINEASAIQKQAEEDEREQNIITAQNFEFVRVCRGLRTTRHLATRARP